MPLYEYQCDACGRRFELIRKFSDPPLDACPTCGGAVHKLASSPAIQFKGSGFYITDYPKKDQPSTGKSDKTEGTKTDGPKTEAAKTDTPKSGGGESSDAKTDKKAAAGDSSSASASTPSSPSEKNSKS
jgi:putative FmdB family regulatory protein